MELDPETYFDTENVKVNNKKEAEGQRVKGNEAIRSKDFDEALKYYTKSLELDSQMYQTYGNRALVYIKTKGYSYYIQIFKRLYLTVIQL
jgi:tetratricopeptide (TPR) repeat protein